MGFKSILKGIGKVALKAAPYAAMAIPGVGVPLGMAIAGASNAASKKLSGGSWKDSLISGGIGAATSAVGGGALKGIGPTSGVLKKIGAGALGKTTGTGIAGKAGGILGNMASSAVGRQGPLVDPNAESMGGNKSWRDLADMGLNEASNRLGGMGQNTMGQPVGGRGRPSDAYMDSGSAAPRQMTESMGNFGTGGNSGYNPVNAGRQAAARDQGFRSGYDVLGSMPEVTDEVPNPVRPILGKIPKINTDWQSMGGRRRQAAY